MRRLHWEGRRVCSSNFCAFPAWKSAKTTLGCLDTNRDGRNECEVRVSRGYLRDVKQDNANKINDLVCLQTR